jgi:hypothetical protein
VSAALAGPGARGDNGAVPTWGSFSYTFGPLVAAAVLALLVLLLRWSFGRGHSVVAPPARTGPPTEYGMLTPVAAPRDTREAGRAEQVLRAAGIPCTVAQTTDGLRVLVWPNQADGALHALGSQPDLGPPQ